MEVTFGSLSSKLNGGGSISGPMAHANTQDVTMPRQHKEFKDRNVRFGSVTSNLNGGGSMAGAGPSDAPDFTMFTMPVPPEELNDEAKRLKHCRLESLILTALAFIWLIVGFSTPHWATVTYTHNELLVDSHLGLWQICTSSSWGWNDTVTHNSSCHVRDFSNSDVTSQLDTCYLTSAAVTTSLLALIFHTHLPVGGIFSLVTGGLSVTGVMVYLNDMPLHRHTFPHHLTKDDFNLQASFYMTFVASLMFLLDGFAVSVWSIINKCPLYIRRPGITV